MLYTIWVSFEAPRIELESDRFKAEFPAFEFHQFNTIYPLPIDSITISLNSNLLRADSNRGKLNRIDRNRDFLRTLGPYFILVDMSEGGPPRGRSQMSTIIMMSLWMRKCLVTSLSDDMRNLLLCTPSQWGYIQYGSLDIYQIVRSHVRNIKSGLGTSNFNGGPCVHFGGHTTPPWNISSPWVISNQGGA